jgi:hypothetical protein
MDGCLKVGHTYSLTGEYNTDQITVLLIRGRELAKGDLVYVNHPKNGLPVVYQVVKVYPHKRVREYEEALLTEGRVLDDVEDSSLHAEAYQWGWMDGEGSLRSLRYPLVPNTQVYAAERDLVANKITGLYAIINGTTNYILTRMAKEGIAQTEVEPGRQILAQCDNRLLGVATGTFKIDRIEADSAHDLLL